MAKIYRFFTADIQEPSALRKDIILSERVDAEIFSQLSRVLRVKEGDHVILIPRSQSESFEYHFAVSSAHKKDVLLQFKERTENHNELGFPLELVLCLPNKPDKLSFIVQKAVELGASSLILTEGDNSQLKHNLRTDRLEKIVSEAAEQSERVHLPAIVFGGSLIETLHERIQLPDAPPFFVAMERSENSQPLELLAKSVVARGCSIVVGPEGGFSDDEKAFIQQHKIVTFSLGRRILRMETAAIVSLGIVSCLIPRSALR